MQTSITTSGQRRSLWIGTAFAAWCAVALSLACASEATGRTNPQSPNAGPAASAGKPVQRDAVVAIENDAVFARLRQQAERKSRLPFDATIAALPERVDKIDYDDYRDIRFRPGRALWRKESLPFRVQFFHRGFLFNRKVDVAELMRSELHPVRFSSALFDYGGNAWGPELDDDVGFAGLRIHYPLNRPDYFDELAVFLGASYYRLLGAGQVYGASARGLAIDTAVASGEEFPFFRQIWLSRPEPGATALTLYALLDGPSVSGAYRFVLSPGASSTARVDATLYLRDTVQKIGLAPLTSMFLFGEASPGQYDDFRPEVHDSDGLLIHGNSGEWIWRPLTNPRQVRVSAFTFDSPRGFGLMQRDRIFDHYQDLESRYERRPSLWVTPSGSWGPGHVELVELPTERESHDNVVAYWVPSEPASPHQAIDFSYTLEASANREHAPSGRTIATRTTGAARHSAQLERDPGIRRFLVDFGGASLSSLAADRPVKPVITATNGTVDAIAVEKNPVDKTWRVHFTVQSDASKPVELRAFLRHGPDVLTETWSYLWETAEPLRLATPER